MGGGPGKSSESWTQQNLSPKTCAHPSIINSFGARHNQTGFNLQLIFLGPAVALAFEEIFATMSVAKCGGKATTLAKFQSRPHLLTQVIKNSIDLKLGNESPDFPDENLKFTAHVLENDSVLRFVLMLQRTHAKRKKKTHHELCH